MELPMHAKCMGNVIHEVENEKVRSTRSVELNDLQKTKKGCVYILGYNTSRNKNVDGKIKKNSAEMQFVYTLYTDTISVV